MADSFTYGGVTFPLSGSTSRSLLQVADPILFAALDFMSAMITAYVGGRLLAEAADADCGANITKSVATALPYEPGPYLRQAQVKFPALFIYRRRATNDYRTTVHSHESSTIDCAYVLPSLSPAQAEHILPIRHAVKLLIADRLEHGWDSSYTPPFAGAVAGQPLWPLAGVEKITVNECTYGGFDGVGDLYLPAVIATITAQERHGKPSSVVLSGMDASIPILASDGTTTPVVADTNSNHVPP